MELAGQPRSSLSRVLVSVNASLCADKRARGSIDRYLWDINRGSNCTVELMTAQGGSPEDIKLRIQARYYQGGLDGVVLIGRLPAAWYEVANDHAWSNGDYGYADWTCDLFFMDMDGSWDDADADRKYDSRRAGAGDLASTTVK